MLSLSNSQTRSLVCSSRYPCSVTAPPQQVLSCTSSSTQLRPLAEHSICCKPFELNQPTRCCDLLQPVACGSNSGSLQELLCNRCQQAGISFICVSRAFSAAVTAAGAVEGVFSKLQAQKQQSGMSSAAPGHAQCTQCDGFSSSGRRTSSRAGTAQQHILTADSCSCGLQAGATCGTGAIAGIG